MSYALPRVVAERIARQVSSAHGIPVDAIMGRATERIVARARIEVQARLRAIQDQRGKAQYSFPSISKVWGMDHTTVVKNLQVHFPDLDVFREQRLAEKVAAE